MIKTFQHKGLERFFKTGNKAGIRPQHSEKLGRILVTLDYALSPEDMTAPGWRLHPLKGKYQGFWAVWVDQNWRVVFRFDGEDVELFDYLDYH